MPVEVGHHLRHCDAAEDAAGTMLGLPPPPFAGRRNACDSRSARHQHLTAVACLLLSSKAALSQFQGPPCLRTLQVSQGLLRPEGCLLAPAVVSSGNMYSTRPCTMKIRDCALWPTTSLRKRAGERVRAVDFVRTLSNRLLFILDAQDGSETLALPQGAEPPWGPAYS